MKKLLLVAALFITAITTTTQLTAQVQLGDGTLAGTGSLTATSQSVTLVLNGKYANTTFSLAGTWTATVQFEASADNFTTSTTINALRAGDNTISQTVVNSTNNDIYRLSTAGFNYVRVTVTAYTSGTINVTAKATTNTSGVFLNFPIPPGTNTVGNVNQTAGTAGFEKITDGTNTAAVTAASTAALATDKGLVVSLSPNSPVSLGATAYVQSTGNNTSAQLAASAIFTGTIESALSYPNAVMSLRCDQPVTITIQQYSDAGGTIQYPDIVYTRTANAGFNQSVTLAGSYYRIKVQNTGASTTTNLFLETWLGILPVIPNLTNTGNMPVDIQSAIPTGANTIGAVNVNGTVPVSGTFFQATQPISAASLPLPTNAATSANVTGLQVTQGSTTSGQNGELIQGAVTTAAPTYTTAQTSPLSLTTAGALRVDNSSTVSPGAVTPYVVAQPGSNQTLAATGTIQWQVTPGGFYNLTLTNAAAATATWVATVGFQTSIDGTSWVNANANPIIGLPGSLATVTSSTTVGLWKVYAGAGVNYIRINCTAYTSGTILALLDADVPNANIMMPFTPSVTSGANLSGWINTSGLQQISMQLSAVTTTVVTVQGTDDIAGTTVQNLGVISDFGGNQSAVSTISATGTWSIINPTHKWVRFQVTTTGTVLTIQGVTAKYGASTIINPSQSSIGLSGGGGVLASQSGTWTVQPGNTANTTAWLVEQRTGTTNGSTTSTLNSAATTNATSLKASAGMLYTITAMNASAAVKYVRIYNKASAPTVGTDVPILIVAIPATSSKEINFSQGIKFATGIAYAITNAAAATDATAVAAGDVQLLINWQ